MGFSIAASSEPSLYWAGDTVLYPAVESIIATAKPDVIIVHACGARWDGDLITMDAAEAVATCRLAPDATVIATHMESLDHATVSRDELRRHAREHGISPRQLLIPMDGETIELASRQD
jgi:L-ascorbate metabolism protein UlaG (beta-lactamase superfamily)